MSKTIEQQTSEAIEEEFHAAAPGFPAGTIPDDLARSLAEDNLLAPELPEANDPDAAFVPGGKGWLLENEDTGPRGPIVWTAPGGLVMIQRVEPGDLVPEDAREFAYNILAAADHAEKGESR